MNSRMTQGTQGELQSEDVRSQGTLTHEYVITQGMIIRE